MKKLPIGIQNFPEIIRGNYLYVDKTEFVYKLAHFGKYYFLSRPRRFGKSLFVSTLKEYFQANRDLFEGLWIYEKVAWEQRKVIHLDFSRILTRSHDLNKALDLELQAIGAEHGLLLTGETSASKFEELIQILGKEKPVAILVDEYDKPIVDHIEDFDLAVQNRKILKNFYAAVKSNDPQIAFFFLTGVSRFSQVSIFSDLNNIQDITLHRDYTELAGYTESDLRTSFSDHLQELQAEYLDTWPEILPVIKEWYDGYSWDGKHFLYNPFSILNLFSGMRFSNFWFRTGTPTFLVKLVRESRLTVFDLENKEIPDAVFNNLELENLEVNSLLFQTGYLTIKSFDKFSNIFTLDFPNKEVKESFFINLLAGIREASREESAGLIRQISNSLEKGETAQFISLMKSLFKNLAYPLVPERKARIEEQEKYYHSIFYIFLKLLGINIETEILTIDARIDAVIRASQRIYILEFKLGDAAEALEQIRQKGYHEKYLPDNKTLILMGISFDPEKRNIRDLLVEEIEKPSEWRHHI